MKLGDVLWGACAVAVVVLALIFALMTYAELFNHVILRGVEMASIGHRYLCRMGILAVLGTLVYVWGIVKDDICE